MRKLATKFAEAFAGVFLAAARTIPYHRSNPQPGVPTDLEPVVQATAIERDSPMTTDGEDRSSWPRNGLRIRRTDLLRLIEENDGPEGLDLRGAIFVGDRLEEDTFENPIHLSREAIQREAANYRSLTGDADPPWQHAAGGAHLGWAQLQGADLNGAQLQGAYLGRAQLQGADLNGAQLQGAHLRRAQLQGADLGGAQLQGADLWGAQLQGAELEGAELQGADLPGAQLQEAYLPGAQLQGAHLPGAQLQGADLGMAQLQRADLRQAHLEGVNLEGAQLQGLNLYIVASLVKSQWSGALLDRTLMSRQSLGKAIGDELIARREGAAENYRRASEAYLLLKNNFNQIGRYEDAAWAYVKEQQMDKMALYWQWRASLRRNWFDFLRWIRNWAFELLSGYGERTWMPVIWAFVVIGGFTAVYAIGGDIAPDYAGDPAAAQGSHSVLDALTHSIAAFSTIGFNSLEPIGSTARLLTAIESALGISLFALFIFTLGNRMSRS